MAGCGHQSYAGMPDPPNPLNPSNPFESSVMDAKEWGLKLIFLLLLELRENELHRQIGHVPQLDVSGGSIANRVEAPANDLVAP